MGSFSLPDYYLVKSFSLRAIAWARVMNSSAFENPDHLHCHTTLEMRCEYSPVRVLGTTTGPNPDGHLRYSDVKIQTEKGKIGFGAEWCLSVLVPGLNCYEPQANPFYMFQEIVITPNWHWTDVWPRWMSEEYYHARHLMGMDTTEADPEAIMESRREAEKMAVEVRKLRKMRDQQKVVGMVEEALGPLSTEDKLRIGIDDEETQKLKAERIVKNIEEKVAKATGARI